jgi:hypothetical protein
VGAEPGCLILNDARHGLPVFAGAQTGQTAPATLQVRPVRPHGAPPSTGKPMIPSRLMLVLFAAVATTACERTVVNVPAPAAAPAPAPEPIPGPPGPAGNTGATGATGSMGADGKTGGSTTVIVVPPAASAPTN